MSNEIHPDIVRYEATTFDEDGGETSSAMIMFTTDGSLTEHLYNFKCFLQAAGFNYVTDVYAITRDGKEVGEE
tara:strand:+ start:183 stop:401 length:219 start_codon:yes stop_codon:yes gene_type:complete